MSEKPFIQVENLVKTYRVPVRPAGLSAAMHSLIRPQVQEVTAVDHINFSIQRGEMIGLIGPNGAGKTTTLKMLSGLLHPTSGSIRVGGYLPWKRAPEYLRTMSMVVGNKNQLIWDIPAADSFNVLKEIYAVPEEQYQATLNELVELLDMKDLLKKPVRNLSLGERMKCELVAALIYSPSVLYLDEPTLGLDISMQLRLRKFFAEYNQRHPVTIILTSHYMADVVALCKRVVLIHQGRVLYDGELNGLAKQLSPFKLLGFNLSEPMDAENVHLPEGVEISAQDDLHLTVRVRRERTAEITALLLNQLPVIDLTIEEPPIEAVIDQIYTEGGL